MTYARKSAQRRVAQVTTAVAPIGGLDDIDPLATMGEQFCIQLINWVPGNAALQARQGYREWVTNLGAPVKTIMHYNAMSGDYNTFAATDNGIYDVTASTAAPVIMHPVTDGHFNSVMFGNVAFQYLVAVGGGSSPSIFYDGTSWKDFIQSATPTNPGEIDGVDPSKFSQVQVFKRRLWFVEQDSMTAWYLPIDATSGVAKPFYFASVFKRGGKLLYIVNWSVDGGDGQDDKLVFVSNLGEVAVYQGTDPDNADAWALVAVFYASAPLGDRAFSEIGGDVLMATTYGIVPLTKTLSGMMSQTPSEQAVSKRISRTLNRIVQQGIYQRNWEMINFPMLQASVVIIPAVGDNPALQFVMNSLTGAWTKLDLPINTGRVARDGFYFGTVDGRVCLYGGENYLDDVKIDGSGGEPVICYLFSAYNYMGDPTSLKHWKLIRPLFQSDQPPSYLLTLNVDYDTAALAGNPAPPAEEQTDPIWDVAIWDQAFWSSSFTTFRPWVGVSALGFCCALLLKVATNDATTLVAIEYVFEKGGVV
jgi:hypothetical protein